MTRRLPKHLARTALPLLALLLGLIAFAPPLEAQPVEIAHLQHDNQKGEYNDWVHLNGDIYVLAFRGSGNSGYISTISISADGTTITEIATLQHSVGVQFNSLVRVAGNTFALAFSVKTGTINFTGHLKTFTISSDGMTITQVTDLIQDNARSTVHSMVEVAPNIFALAYSSAFRGRLKTFSACRWKSPSRTGARRPGQRQAPKTPPLKAIRHSYAKPKVNNYD